MLRLWLLFVNRWLCVEMKLGVMKVLVMLRVLLFVVCEWMLWLGLLVLIVVIFLLSISI